MGSIAIKVNRHAEKAILKGHPWVYDKSITKQSRKGQPGDVAVLFDQRANKLLAVGLYDPESPIRIRILSIRKSIKLEESFFISSFTQALTKRTQLLKSDTTAYRLIYGENDFLPGLIVDIYNEIAVVKIYTNIWKPYLTFISEALVELHLVTTVLLRQSRNISTETSPIKILEGKLVNSVVTFKEHGLEFTTDLIKGHKTGYFLDHRHNRFKVRGLAKGQDVLDVFSYAGGFSANAAKGEARSITSVDISKQALKVASKNVKQANPNTPHITFAGDAFQALDELHQQNKKYGLIIIDPPSFASNEKQVDRAKKSYLRLLGLALPLIQSNGILLMASCTARIKAEEYFDLITSHLNKEQINHQVIETTRHDEDHPEMIPELSYLKSMYIQILK